MHVAQRNLRLLTDLGQQLNVVPRQTHDGVALEQLVGVIEGQVEATVTVFLAVKLQVELGLAAVPRQFFGEQPRQATQCAEVALLVVEHDLKQPVFAGLRKRFDQLFERHVLMRLSVQRGLAGLGQQCGKRQARIELRTQHQGVDEEADQALGFMTRTVGTGHADANVGLPAVAMQQGLEARQQEHERR